MTLSEEVGYVKDRIGEKSLDYDTLIGTMIDQAHAFIENEVGRPLWGGVVPFTAYLNGSGSYSLVVPVPDIQSITSLTVNDLTIPAAVGTTDNGWILTGSILNLRGYWFHRGIRNVCVVGTCGLEAPPADAESVLVELVALKFKRGPKIDLGSMAVGGQTTQAFTRDELTPQQVKALGNLKKWF